MNKLNELIQEAKPLYKQRKKQKRIFLLMILMILPVSLCGLELNQYTQGSQIYLALKNNNLENTLKEDEFGLLGIPIENNNKQIQRCNQANN